MKNKPTSLLLAKNAVSFFAQYNQKSDKNLENKVLKEEGKVKVTELKTNELPEFDSGEETSDITPKLGKRTKCLDELDLESLTDEFSETVDFDALENEMCESLLGPNATGPIKMTKQPKVYIPNKRQCKSKE